MIYICGSRKIIRYNGTIEKSAARTPGLTRAHKVYRKKLGVHSYADIVHTASGSK